MKEDEPFGKLNAFVSVIVFQNRGLVHAHIICSLDDSTKFSLQDPIKIDNRISAEIPPVTSPHILELVLKHMIHALSSDYSDSRCMREGRCSENFPKPFRSETASIEGDNYLSYISRSPEEGGEFEVRTKKSNATGIQKMAIDNSWVIPHSPDLL